MRAAAAPAQPARVAGAYVEAIRNTPLLVQIFIVYFGLASIGLKVGAFTAATAGAGHQRRRLHGARSCAPGIESIQRSQIEAAECLALGRWQVLRHVILRPAIERVYPALTSQFVLLMLATSITSQISAEELTAVANRVQSDTFRSFETYLIVAAAYLVLSLLMRVRVLGRGQRCLPAPPPAGDTAVTRLDARAPAVPAARRRLDPRAVAARLRRRRAAGLRRWRCRASTRRVRCAGWRCCYIQLIQGTPLLILLFLAYFGLPALGLVVDPLVAAAIGLTIYVAAYLGEIWRGCIEAVPRTQ